MKSSQSALKRFQGEGMDLCALGFEAISVSPPRWSPRPACPWRGPGGAGAPWGHWPLGSRRGLRQDRTLAEAVQCPEDAGGLPRPGRAASTSTRGLGLTVVSDKKTLPNSFSRPRRVTPRRAVVRCRCLLPWAHQGYSTSSGHHRPTTPRAWGTPPAPPFASASAAGVTAQVPEARQSRSRWGISLRVQRRYPASERRSRLPAHTEGPRGGGVRRSGASEVQPSVQCSIAGYRCFVGHLVGRLGHHHAGHTSHDNLQGTL